MIPDTLSLAPSEVFAFLEDELSEAKTKIALLQAQVHGLEIERNSFEDTSGMLNEESIRLAMQLDNTDIDSGLRIAALKSDNKRIRESNGEFVRECVRLRKDVRLWQMIAWAAIGGLVAHALIILWSGR